MTSILIIFIMVIVYHTGTKTYDKFSISSYKIIRQKEYYRLFTSAFIHLNSLHLIVNAMGMYIFGLGFEIKYGSLFFIITFFVSSFLSNTLSVIIQKQNKEYTSCGASGGIFGVVYFLVCSNPLYDLAAGLLPFIIPAVSIAIIFMAVSLYSIVMGKESYEDSYAHFFGSLTGIIVYFIFFLIM
jgi:membrane associated rhomboid family serine protease